MRPLLPPPRRTEPLRRLGFAALCLAAAVILFAASGAIESAAFGLRVVAVVAAVVSLGCAIAAGLGSVRNLYLRLAAAFPTGVRRVHLGFGYLLIFGLGALSIYWSIDGIVSGNAPVISRHAGTVNVADDPTYFWVSTVFHFLLGLFLIWAVLYAAYRRRKHAV